MLKPLQICENVFQIFIHKNNIKICTEVRRRIANPNCERRMKIVYDTIYNLIFKLQYIFYVYYSQ